MDNEHLAHNENFPLEAAKDWIGRWKAAGGGFFCHPQPDGSVMVQLAATSEQESARISPEQDEIQNEILWDPDLKSAVTTLVAQAWNRASNAPNLMNIEPAGHA